MSMNPFKYGTIVTGEDFVDREKELADLLREIRSKKSIVLYSDRRLGKSSLLSEFMRRNSKKYRFVFIDLYGMTDKSQLLEEIVEKTTSAVLGKVENIAAGLWGLLKSARLRLVVTPEGKLGIEPFKVEPTPGDITEILDLPEKLAKKKRKQVVVIFDEFQEASSFDGVSLLKLMRSRFQQHGNVVYIFCGSKRHVLHQMFDEREGAFYKFARPIELGNIPRVDFEKFIVSRFRSAGGSMKRDLAAEILKVTGGHPYYTQQIAHELFDIARSPKQKQDVELAVSNAVEHQKASFLYAWETTKSSLQRKYLVALAKEPGGGYSYEFIQKFGLRSSSHVQKAEKSLEARGLIENGRIVDPIFALWLRSLA
ncbi:MAG: hypothetical protein A3K60_03565 [Euryarchaeota archaeon RBG_19FT_COMBO_56_21]|nr:MAG: hypothetical protein A3K60_03565 [Euryarchaeota archaeon RBG_19FT_COMBO_56_21]